MGKVRTKYDAARLAPIVKDSSSFSEVVRKLGITPNGGNHRMISARVRLAELDTSHFLYRRRDFRAQVEAVPIDRLSSLVKRARSYAQVLAELELPTEGRAHHLIKARLESEGIDVSHLRGPGWSRGESAHSDPSVARGVAKRRRPDTEVFIENSPDLGSRRIIQRLLAMGLVYACSKCHISKWLGEPLVLHLDHINGIHNDNRIPNLRLLCPNCHSQTPTYCGKAREVDLIRAAWPCYTRRSRERGGIGYTRWF